MIARIILIVIVGWFVGCALRGRPVEAQNASAVVAIDSVSGLPVRIDTNGTNALKVVGQ